MGESGVGKTEVARTLHRCFDGKKKLAKVNFGNYSSEFSLSSLIGSARGYIGSEDGEIFIRVRDTDVGVILIDEFEKSNATLFNYFLDVLESGKIISSLAEEIDLNGFIIIFTSILVRKISQIKSLQNCALVLITRGYLLYYTIKIRKSSLNSELKAL